MSPSSVSCFISEGKATAIRTASALGLLIVKMAGMSFLNCTDSGTGVSTVPNPSARGRWPGSPTRWSQVTHYYFDDCIYYTPAFSDESVGQLQLRNLVAISDGLPRRNSYLGESAEALLKSGPRSAGGLRAGLEAAGVAIEMAHGIAREAMAGVRHAPYGTPNAPAAPEPPTAPQPPAKPEAPRPPDLPHVPTFPAFGGQVVTGTLNGGGVEIRATTMSGEIQIREAK